MDQEFLKQLETLSRMQLPPDLVRELIEHDKWSLKEQHRHEKELALLGVLPKEKETPRKNNREEDEGFNSHTSNGVCKSNHIGLIAKQKVMTGAAQQAKDLAKRSDFPVELLTLLITISWCGHRLMRWPQASDAQVAIGLRKDFKKAVDKYSASSLLKSIDYVSQHLDLWDTRIVVEQIDSLREEYEKKQEVSILSSPLFAEFHKNYPYILPDKFNSCFTKHNEEFVTAAIYLLRREFINTPPPELNHIEGWKQRWPQYLPNYLKQWQEDLRKMESRMRMAQRAWKESIY